VYQQSFCCKINCTKVDCKELHKSPDETDKAQMRDSDSRPKPGQWGTPTNTLKPVISRSVVRCINSYTTTAYQTQHQNSNKEYAQRQLETQKTLPYIELEVAFRVVQEVDTTSH